MQGKTAKPPHLDAFAVGERGTHLLDHALDRHFHIRERKMHLAPGKRLDQFGSGHGTPMSLTLPAGSRTRPCHFPGKAVPYSALSNCSLSKAPSLVVPLAAAA